METLFETDYCIVRAARGTSVAVYVGQHPEEETPTIIDSRALALVLLEYSAESVK